MLEHTFEVGPTDDRNLIHASSGDLESFDRYVKLLEKSPDGKKPVRSTIKKHKTAEDAQAFTTEWRESRGKTPKPSADELVENSIKVNPPAEIDE